MDLKPGEIKVNVQFRDDHGNIVRLANVEQDLTTQIVEFSVCLVILGGAIMMLV